MLRMGFVPRAGHSRATNAAAVVLAVLHALRPSCALCAPPIRPGPGGRLHLLQQPHPRRDCSQLQGAGIARIGWQFAARLACTVGAGWGAPTHALQQHTWTVAAWLLTHPASESCPDQASELMSEVAAAMPTLKGYVHVSTCYGELAVACCLLLIKSGSARAMQASYCCRPCLPRSLCSLVASSPAHLLCWPAVNGNLPRGTYVPEGPVGTLVGPNGEVRAPLRTSFQA